METSLFKKSVIEESWLIQASPFNIMILFKHNKCKHSSCVSCFAVKRSNSPLFTVNNEDFVDSVTRYSALIIRFSSFIRKKIFIPTLFMFHIAAKHAVYNQKIYDVIRGRRILAVWKLLRGMRSKIFPPKFELKFQGFPPTGF